MTILIIILSVIAVLLIMAFFSNNEMNIESTAGIALPAAQVFAYIKMLRNHENFNVWAMMDPDMKKEYKGTDGETGFVFAWESDKKKNVGTGEQEIKSIGENFIDYEIRFIRPMQDTATARMTTEAISPSVTRVHWTFSSQLKFPMTLMKPLIKNMLRKNIATGLSTLKSILEKQTRTSL